MSTVYYIISGAVTAYRASEFVDVLSQRFERVLTVQTPNAMRLISPRELARIPKNHVIEGYFDERILPRPAPGPVVFAPCNFNSLNKLANGIADNLALSIVAEMIGFPQRVLVALSLNEPLFAHPIVSESIAKLRGWGVRVIEPRDAGDGFMMAPTEEVITALDANHSSQ
jgi:phosphopantothenoylcysteine synthetase/decarboxylase